MPQAAVACNPFLTALSHSLERRRRCRRTACKPE
jgi:hypothetical protein